MATTIATKSKKSGATGNAEKPTPVHKAKMGALQLAIWENQYTDNDGNARIAHTITLKRSYIDKNEQWQETSQLRDKDIGNALALLGNAQQFLVTEA